MDNIPDQDLELMSKAEKRKINKPIMEKRRRDRINLSLIDIKSLVLERSEGEVRHSKLEKADILEMAVNSLKSLQHRNRLAEENASSHYRTGYLDCVSLINQFYEAKKHLSNDQSRLQHYLLTHITSQSRRGPPDGARITDECNTLDLRPAVLSDRFGSDSVKQLNDQQSNNKRPEIAAEYDRPFRKRVCVRKEANSSSISDPIMPPLIPISSLTIENSSTNRHECHFRASNNGSWAQYNLPHSPSSVSSTCSSQGSSLISPYSQSPEQMWRPWG